MVVVPIGAPASAGPSSSTAVPQGAPSPVFVAGNLCKTYGSGEATVMLCAT